jgi:hypothetical protein
MNKLYTVTKSEFWFSMIPPSERKGKVRSSVLPNCTVLEYTFIAVDLDVMPLICVDRDAPATSSFFS